MTAVFDALHPALRYHIVNTLGWPDLRPTQAEAVGPVMAGENCLLLAPTAGGKTEAAIFPLLSRVAAEGWRGLSTLYICPLKALLNNIAPRIEQYAGFLGMRVGLWHGDIGASARQRMLRDPPEILLTTPESLEAMMISARLDHAAFLSGIRAAIVDELHAFAGDDRGWHLLFLLARLERLAGRPIQRIGLTATVGNPDRLLDWFTMRRGGRVIGPTRPVADGDVTADHVGSLSNAITVISRLHRGERRLVFADSRSRVEEIAGGLRQAGVRTFVSHAALSQDERRQAEAAFSAEPACVIVATSTLELGLDVGDLDRVIQVGAPPSVASFLQRMGRSGRRQGTRRNILFLATDDEELLTGLALVRLWREGNVEPVVPPPRPAHIFAQQVMALILQLGALDRSEIASWLGRALHAVPVEDRIAVIDHMLAEDVLADDDGVLGLGRRGEREFGRKHFSDLVAAFAEPLQLFVRHGPTDVGTVHPASLTPSANGERPVLSLAGRSWRVIDVDWRRRSVAVVPSDRPGRSRWLGSGRSLSGTVSQAAEAIVAGAEPDCRLSHRAQAALETIRSRLPFVDGSHLPVVSTGDGRVTIWTFGGTASSLSIARELAVNGFPLADVGDLSISVRGAPARKIADCIRRIDPDRAHPKLPDELSDALKFGLCLPDNIASKVLTMRARDPAAVHRIVSRETRLVSDPWNDDQ